MSGERDLNSLIAGMRPVLDPERYVFASTELPLPALMRFEEAEGTTLIMSEASAIVAGVDFEFPCHRITLAIHSALDAVGFLARITNRLAAADMGVNPVSGFYHDHLFVPADRASDAMKILAKMSAQAAREA